MFPFLTRVLVPVLSILTIGCSSTGAVPRPFPAPGAPASPSPRQPERVARRTVPLRGADIARTALTFAGTPYRLGGADPSGFDCSGLVQYVLALHGVGVPRVVHDQAQLGRTVGQDDITAGDLIFFKVGSRRPTHVAIAIDGERFVHAPKTGERVRVDGLSSTYWRERYAGARRIEAEPSGGAMLTLGDESP